MKPVRTKLQNALFSDNGTDFEVKSLCGKLNNYLAEFNKQAEELFSRLVKQLAKMDGIAEALKA